MIRILLPALLILSSAVSNLVLGPNKLHAGQLRAGVAKVDITNEDAGPVDGRMHVRVLVISNEDTDVVLITVDAVAIGEIGHIGNDYLPNVRAAIKNELEIDPSQVIVNASHCHGIICDDIEQRTIRAVRQAASARVPVRIGAGTASEDRVMENRRLTLKSGKVIDVRHAYALPPDEKIAAVGPVDPEIGLLRLDRLDGTPLAVVYNFACHPIQGVPSGANTADMTGFASELVEETLGHHAVALFVQGCAGDINPVSYKAVDRPRSAEVLGNFLGLSALEGLRKVQPSDDTRLKIVNETLALPRADLGQRIVSLNAERDELVRSLQGTFLNLDSFLPLIVKYRLADPFPSASAYEYLRQQQRGRHELKHLDKVNRANIDAYIRNVRVMEQITRINTNLRLLEKHQQQMLASGRRTINAELTALRIGNFVLTTFPGELTVRIGLNIKQRSSHPLTFVAGYTNGYLYYAPTAKQLGNVGGAQEDSDCLLAPQWQELYETKVAEVLADI